MSYKRILTVQDISCVGQCSLTVALPILSACGLETAIIPSAVLSNHTAFSSFTFKDLTEEIPKIREAWEKQNIKFEAVYTGYLGNASQVAYVKDIMEKCLCGDAVKIVDPAMADNGKLYVGFDADYVEEMKKLCCEADIILPNITEACLLTGEEYKQSFDKEYVENLMARLFEVCGAKVVLTGVGFSEDKSGVAVFDGTKTEYYEHKRIGNGCHGTGDIYASAFTGAFMNGKSLLEAAKIAADYTVLCIEETVQHKDHWYGARFEPVLGKLIDMINKNRG